MMKQKDAVVIAVTKVLGEDFTVGTTVVKDVITKDQKSEVRGIVLQGILDGEVAYNKDLADEKAIGRYVNSMVDNHFRKAKELNGGSTYRPASTGTRRDPQLKELNKLLKSLPEDSEGREQVLEHIEIRNKQLDEARAQKRSAASIGEIDVDVLPQHLRGLVDNSSPETAEGSAE